MRALSESTAEGPSAALAERLLGDRREVGLSGYGKRVSAVGGVVYAARYNRSVYVSHVYGRIFARRRDGGVKSRSSASSGGTKDAHSIMDLKSIASLCVLVDM